MRRISGLGLGRSALSLVLTIVVVTSLASAANASALTKKSHLSLSSVTIAGGLADNGSFPYFAAQALGYYRQAGLAVTFVDNESGGSNLVASLLGGAYTFINPGAGGLSLAEAEGAPIRPLMTNGYGTPDELAISSSTAATDHIPATGVRAQLQAIRGSHLVIGISNTSSTTYQNLLTFLQTNGIVTSGGGADVSFQSLGSPTNLTAALNANKVQAIANQPPVTVLQNTVTIQFGLAAPISKEPGFFLETTTTTIQQHPDTVQALVTASVKGWQYTATHRASALKFARPYIVATGVTSPEEVEYLVADQLKLIHGTPAITQSGYNTLRTVISNGAGVQISESLSQFVAGKFVANAIRKLNLKLALK